MYYRDNSPRCWSHRGARLLRQTAQPSLASNDIKREHHAQLHSPSGLSCGIYCNLQRMARRDVCAVATWCTTAVVLALSMYQFLSRQRGRYKDYNDYNKPAEEDDSNSTTVPSLYYTSNYPNRNDRFVAVTTDTPELEIFGSPEIVKLRHVTQPDSVPRSRFNTDCRCL